MYLWDWETFIITANIATRLEAQHDQIHPPTQPKRTAVICAGSYVHGSRFVFPAVADPQRDVRVLPASTPLREMIDQLNDYQPDRIIGYSSLVEELAVAAVDGMLRVQPNWISVNSEPLTQEARDMAQKAWGVNIHNAWGSVEVGLTGTEGDSFSGMTMAEDFLVFEAVDAHDQPMAGPQADRLLVTKLFGHVMPMIRYEMTDMVVIDDGPNPDAPGYRRVTQIKGRADQWFIYGQTKIHPMIFRGVLGQRPQIIEYQVQQTPAGARVLAIAHGEVDVSQIRRQLIQELAVAGLPDADIAVDLVEALPRHAETSKLKRFVPLA